MSCPLAKICAPMGFVVTGISCFRTVLAQPPAKRTISPRITIDRMRIVIIFLLRDLIAYIDKNRLFVG
jgi:hypothetical protein